jgi:hypothetical protein
MSTPKWVTPEGRVLYRAEISKHHIAHERRDYKTSQERKYRQMGGMVLLLGNQVHADLHRQVCPPPKPNEYLMADIYQHARLQDYEDSYDLFKQITNYVGMVAEGGQCQENVHDANLLHQNLIAQAGFIELGRLTLLREEKAA